MPSPFPGVDPYVEASGRWLGFHNAFITYCSEYLNRRLPPHYAANIEERVELVEQPEANRRSALPDVSVTRDRAATGPRPAQRESGSVATIEPEILTLPPVLEVPEAFVEIVELPSRELVTSVELLSPANKSRVGRGQYLAKRRAMIRRGVNLVEIDLLLSGERLETVEPLPSGDYYAFVSRADRRPHCEVYAWGIRRPMPPVPVPLKPPDPDVPL